MNPNLKPISLLNICTKLFFRLKKCLTFFFFPQSNCLCKRQIYKKRWIKGLSVAVDVQKPFDSVNSLFLLSGPKKYGFGESFINLMKVLLKNLVKLGKGTGQGEPISVYLFILIFLSMNKNKNIIDWIYVTIHFIYCLCS